MRSMWGAQWLVEKKRERGPRGCSSPSSPPRGWPWVGTGPRSCVGMSSAHPVAVCASGASTKRHLEQWVDPELLSRDRVVLIFSSFTGRN